MTPAKAQRRSRAALAAVVRAEKRLAQSLDRGEDTSAAERELAEAQARQHAALDSLPEMSRPPRPPRPLNAAQYLEWLDGHSEQPAASLPPQAGSSRAPRSRSRSNGSRSRGSPSSSRDDDDPHDLGPAPGRARPALAITVALEGRPNVRLCCESYEDEQRLRLWLCGSGWIERLVADLEVLRDLLEREAE
jgi:hypothetical protein